MKQLILLLCFSIYNILLFAQENPFHAPLSTLDLDSIATGYLYDHTFSWGSMALFDGSYQDTLSNTKINWLQLHLDLERAKVNDVAQIGSYIEKDTLARNILESTGNIPLMVLNIDYNYILPLLLVCEIAAQAVFSTADTQISKVSHASFMV